MQTGFTEHGNAVDNFVLPLGTQRKAVKHCDVHHSVTTDTVTPVEVLKDVTIYITDIGEAPKFSLLNIEGIAVLKDKKKQQVIPVTSATVIEYF